MAGCLQAKLTGRMLASLEARRRVCWRLSWRVAVCARGHAPCPSPARAAHVPYLSSAGTLKRGRPRSLVLACVSRRAGGEAPPACLLALGRSF